MLPVLAVLAGVLDVAAHRARESGVFGAATVTPGMLACSALRAPAFYRLFAEGGRLWVALVTPDRWLSQSVEQDLVHTGDKLEDLLEEELVDLGLAGLRLAFEHFRSEDKLFTFRSPLPREWHALPPAELGNKAAMCLLAYEACFRRLGDIDGGDEE
jgi:hypothetical protein